MGIGGIGIWQLLIVLVIVLLLFGTKKLRNLGGDLGGAIKGFKKAVNEAKPDAIDKEGADKSATQKVGEANQDNAEQGKANSQADRK